MIDARPEEIYAVLSDYQEAHAAILPKPDFTEVTVEQGGIGAGTGLRVRMKVMGVERSYHLLVSEPEPGRVLVETDADAGLLTTFTVEPLNEGKQSRVTITIDAKASPGIMGLMERLMNPPVTRRIYRQELQQLADDSRSKHAAASKD
jgi:carbon monoxide dehydrogenase subunit G